MTAPRVKRPCLYCSATVINIPRHLKSRHPTKISDVLLLPPKEQTKKFAAIRNAGIEKFNVKMAREGKSVAEFMRNRTSKNLPQGLSNATIAESFSLPPIKHDTSVKWIVLIGKLMNIP